MLISVPTRHTWYHRPQTNFCTATSAARLLLLKSSRDTKRMVRNDWVLMIFQFFCSPFFQWNGSFQCQCTTHDITAHRPIFAHTAAACLPLLKSSSDVKCKVRNLWVLIIFQFFCLPFLQWNSTFSAHAPHMILQPIDHFLPWCCCCLPIKQQCKKNGEDRKSVV